MYEKFYGFTEKPFNTTPDPRFFFPSNKHTEALNSLIYAVQERKGFVVITGEIGAGKTTVSRALLNKLDMNTKVALITNTHITAKELIAQILQELEVEYKPGGKQKLLAQLNDYLIRQLSADANVVLIIDEAQNLKAQQLEQIRLLSNLETDKDKLLQIVLVGQPELNHKLSLYELRQLQQRIMIRYHISPLDKLEVKEYIRHRLNIAGAANQIDFTDEATEMVFNFSGGTPRLINIICDRALLAGYVAETNNIDAGIINKCMEELGSYYVTQ